MAEPHIHTTVLVVEDDPLVAMTHRDLVVSCGYDAVIARDGEEALEAFRSRVFRLVICDWQMPVMDGLTLCRAVRELQLSSYVYFILVTQMKGKPALLEAMNAGVDDFISKPLSRDSLYLRLRVAARILGFREAIDRLKKLIPVCMYCGSIDAGKGEWMKPVDFLEKHLECDVSHGICPACFSCGAADTPHNPSSTGKS